MESNLLIEKNMQSLDIYRLSKHNVKNKNHLKNARIRLISFILADKFKYSRNLRGVYKKHEHCTLIPRIITHGIKNFQLDFSSESKTITEILFYKLDSGYCEVFD
jgi:hypothetical protein